MSLKNDVIKLLSDKDVQLSFNELLNKFNVSNEELASTLNELEKEGTVYLSKRKQLYCLSENHGLTKANIVRMLKRYAIAEYLDKKGEKDSVRIDLDDLNGAIYMDYVLLSNIDSTPFVFKIISRNQGNVVGEFFPSRNAYVLPDDQNYDFLIHIKNYQHLKVRRGHKVAVKIYKYEPVVEGEIIVILGHKNDPKVDIMSLVYAHRVPSVFSEEVMQEINDLDERISNTEINSRLDLRDHLICTMDGKDAKDLDDAIEVKRNEDGTYELGVHIADVSYFVKEGSAIDKEAFNRGTSVYMVDTVIPMLPHALCNGLCSLNAHEDHLTLSCIMTINEEGDVVDYNIAPSIINSKKRFTYDEVNYYYNGKKKFSKDLNEMLDNALKLSKILRKKKNNRGSLELETDEAYISVDKNGKPIDISLRKRDKAEMLIEDFMIAANECVATHIYWQNLPFVYRVHDKPKQKRISDFSRLIRPLGYLLKGENNGIHPKELQSLLNRIKDSDVKDIISTLMLRSLAKAKYDVKNIGHFGLASDCYTHFTSPIRRYPDLMVHRLLKLYNSYEKINYDDLLEKLIYQCEQCSVYERRAIDLERDVESMKKAEYMMDKVNEIYIGKISGMIRSGFFVSLDNTVEGMVRFETMNDDYYEFDENNMVIVGEGSKKVLKLGDKVKIKVKSASKDTGQIDFYFLRKMK